MVVETPVQKVRFGTRYAEHLVVVHAPRPRYHPVTGAYLENDTGKVIRFKDFLYETDDPEEIDHLRKMTLHGSMEVVELTEPDQIVASKQGVEVTGALSAGKGSVKPEGRYPCTECGKAFRNPQALAFHKNTHKVKAVPEGAPGS